MDGIARKLLAGEIADGSVIEVKASADGLEIGKAVVHQEKASPKEREGPAPKAAGG